MCLPGFTRMQGHGRFDSVTSNYLAMSEDYLTMPEVLNLKDIDVYELFTDEEKEKVNEIIAEAFARNYGVEGLNDFDYDIKGEIL